MNTTPNKTPIYFGLFLSLIISIFFGTYHFAVDITTHEDDIEMVKPKQKKPVRYFGVVSRYTPREIYLGYQPIMDYLTTHTPFKFELKLSESYEGTVHQLASGHIAVASLGSYIYVTMKDEYNLEVILKPFTRTGETVYRSMFITQDTSSIQSIIDLAGKSIVFPSKESLTGQWMPNLIFDESKLTPTDFNQLTFVSHHTTVAEKVLKGDYDAGVVKEVIAHAYEEKGIRIFHTAPPRSTIPLVVSSQTDSLTISSIIAAFIKINPRIDTTKQMLQTWDAELSYGFSRAVDADYNVVRDIIRSIGE